VGVHIADVSYYVKIGDIIDKNAGRRGTTYYPATGKAYHMLPEILSGELCSLKEGKLFKMYKCVINFLVPRIIRKLE